MSVLAATVRTDPHQERERALAGALARLAFGAAPSGVLDNHSVGPRHLAFLPPEVLELDLDDPAQRQFGDYELLAKLGQGGMGVVYRARQRSLDREVALKLLSAGPWASRDFIERFRREAQSAARMQHPNIVPVFEIGSHEELNFFSMRLVHGLSLSHELAATGPLPPKRAAQLMRIIAEALDYAHRLGVLHLDLKPGNVLMDERGEPQVADFGLARRLDETLATDNDEVSGTPSYMAPEQAVANSQKLSPATDIYGLGAILYELLTGVPPFLGPTAQETLQRVVSEAPDSPRRVRADVPRDLDAICMKCLEKDPARRYPNARELAADLGRYLDGRPVSVRPLNPAQQLGRWVRRHPELAALGALLFLALAGGLGATAVQWRRAEVNAAASNQRLWEGRREAALRLEQVGEGYEAAARLLQNVAEREQVEGPDAAATERNQLGVLFGQSVALIDSILIADANPLAAELSGDGRTLAVAFNDSTVRWFDTRTLTEQGRVDLTDQPTSEGYFKLPAVMRFIDERRLHVMHEWYDHFVSPAESDSFLIDLERKALVEPPEAFADLADATYSPDGAYALLRNQAGEMQLWQVAPWKPLSRLTSTRAMSVQPWRLGREARYAARNLSTSHLFELYDPRDLSKPLKLTVPVNSGFSAWTESGDGRWLALGDTEGRLFLMDLATREFRILPMPRGNTISWIAFSESDEWLAACSLGGYVHAFEVASGTPLGSGVMQTAFELHRVAISRRHRLLVASGLGQTALWRLPEPGPQAREPSRLGTGPTRDAMAGKFSAGWSLAAGLLATAGVGGEIRLWRVPDSPTLTSAPPRLLSDTLHYDGKRIVDVAANKIRIVAPDGKPLTPWLELPRPAGYADLVADGETLVLTLANELHVYDSTTLRPRFAPLPLPGTPQNLVTAKDGAVAVMSFGAHGPEGYFEEQLLSVDLKAGRRLPGSASKAGSLRQLVLSDDNRLLLATGTRGVTSVYETDTLERLGEYTGDAETPVIWAAFAPEPNTLWLALRAADERLQEDALVLWDWREARERAREPLPNLRPIGVLDTPLGAFVVGSNYEQLDPGGPRAARPERMARSTPVAGTARSPDGRLLAQAFRHEVQVYDARTLAPMGPPLYTDAGNHDWISNVAFAQDSRSLLARSTAGSWFAWTVAQDLRPVAELAQVLQPLRERVADDAPRRMASPADRQRLRRLDRGPWLPFEARPQDPVARRAVNGPIAARAADTDPLLLDLTRVYNLAPDQNVNEKSNMIAMLRFLGGGLQRLVGVDYDIRGMVQIGPASFFGGATGPGQGEVHYSDPASPYADSARGIAVPPVPVAAFHVLLFVGHRSTEPEERVYAQIRLHYRDGGSAVLPMRTRREVPGWTANDGPVPFGWAFGNHLKVNGAPEMIMVSNPRLPNPHPDRIVATLDLEPGDGTWNAPVFVAVTAEPVIRPAADRITGGDAPRAAGQ